MQVFLLNISIDRFIAAFSGMLLHSLWQGLVFATIVSLVMLFGKTLTAAARYNFLLLVLAASVLTAGFTFLAGWMQAGNSNPEFTGGRAAIDTLFPWLLTSLQPVKPVLDKCGIWLASKEWLIATIWLLVFVTRVAKMTGDIIYNSRVKQKAVKHVAVEWHITLEKLRAALKIDKAVVLMQSAYMKMPVVIGHIKPVILMPAGLLLSLTASQAEAILLHELAHIKRNDYLVNVVQHIITSIFFFNPAMLWIAALLKEEREHCCDDIALTQTQNHIGLAEALIHFKQYQLQGSVLQIAFPGAKNQLLRRVSRILGMQEQPQQLLRRLLLGISLLIVCATTATALLLKLKQQKVITTTISLTQNLPVRTVNNDLQKQHNNLQQQDAARTKTSVVYYHKMASPRTPAIVAIEKESILTDQERVLLDQKKAMEDMAKANIDEKQAFLDQQQAMIDQRQAMVDQQKAKDDQLLFELDRANTMIQKEKSMLDRQTALRDKKEAERRALQLQAFSSRP